MPQQINVVFDADSSRFVNATQNASESARKAGDAIAAAKNKILDSFNAQVAAATKVGVSAQQLERLQTKAAASMASVTESNATRIVNSLDRISERQKRVAAELGNLKVPEVPEVEASDITARMRASALLKGGGLRAAENFASQFSAFNSVAAVAFPVVGAAALTAELVRGGEAAAQYVEHLRALPESIRDGFESVNAPLMLNVDNLRKENDEIEIQIGKIEHKPVNNLALALDEDRINADKLADSADHAYQSVQKLLQENQSGLANFALTGQIATGRAADEAQRRLKELRDATRANRDAERSGNDTPEAAASRAAAIAKQYQSLYEWAHKSRVEIQSFNTDGKLDANVNLLEGVEDFAYNSIQEQQQQKRNVDLTGQKNQALASKQSSSDDNKAAEARLRAMEAYVNQWKLLAPVTSKAIFDYWEVQKASFAQGSSEYNAIVQKQATIAEEGARKFAETISKYKAQQKELNAPLSLDRSVNVLGNNDQSSRALDRSVAGSNLAFDSISAAMQKARVEIDLSNGSLSKLAAEQKIAAINAEEHRAKLADLQQQIAELKTVSGTYNPVLDRFASNKDQAQYTELQAKVAQENADAQIAAMRSAAIEAGQTWTGALRQAGLEWAQSATDVGAQIKSLLNQSLSGINNQVANLATGERTHWAQTFQGVAHSGVTSALGGIEGAAMKAFGLHGKADGSKANPFYVIGAGIGAGATSAISSAASGVSGFAAKIGSFFSGLFGGGKAVGGSVDPSQFYLVGEHGPELWAPGRSGSIIPNNQMRSSASTASQGNTFYSISVGSGVTPEQMDMHVRAALQQYHGTVQRTSVQSVRDSNRRVPSSHRN